jgi:hypothetical protein
MAYTPIGGARRDQRALQQNQGTPARTRRAVRARDDHRCRLCGVPARQLDVHHMDGRGARDMDPNHAMNNLVTLCKGCHAKVHSEALYLTWAIVERAEAIRRGDEVLYVPSADDPRFVSMVGDRKRTWSVTRKPDRQVFYDNPDLDCPEDCPDCRALGL